jgi:acyl-CoA synthetase (NDP forming)
MVKKVVAVVVVSAEMDALGKRLQELQKLVYKASLAFEMLIIKNKILMT